MKRHQYLLAACCLSLSCAWGQEARTWSYTASIVPKNGTKVNQDGDTVIFDRASDKEQAKVSLVAKPEFQADPGGQYVEWEDKRQYQWEKVEGITMDNPQQQTVECTTTEKAWGKDLLFKVRVKSIIVNKKREPASADASKKAVTPLIKIKSASFSESAGGNGFIIVDQFQGKPVSTPEFIRDDQKKDDDKSPIGFYAGQTPMYRVQLDVKPASLAKISAKCDGGIFSTEETTFMVNGSGEAEDKVYGTQALERMCKSSPEKKDDDNPAEEILWSFSFHGVPLSWKDNMDVHQYYVLLDKGKGDRPWKNLLKAAFEHWSLNGACNHEELMNQLSQGIASSAEYNYDGWKPEEGKRTSLYVNQKQSPMPLAVGQMVDAFCGLTKPKIICVEAAGLMEYAANVLGQGGVSSRGVNWTETGQVKNPETGQMEDKRWSNGHGYGLFGSDVHDPVPGGGPTGLKEKAFIDQKIRKPHRSNVTEPRTLNFQFNK